VVHPFDYSTEETLLDFLQKHIPESFLIINEKKLQDGRNINLGGIVHKLDRDTSGVMVITKNQSSYDALKKIFTEHTLEKKYVALVEGIVGPDKLHIDAPLGRNKKDYKQSVNPINPRGELRSAVTDIKVIRRNGTTTLVELTPKTGRTHQLRAHMTHLGHPILGDKAYGSMENSSRIMLHAQKLSFTLFGKDYNFEAESDLNLDVIK